MLLQSFYLGTSEPTWIGRTEVPLFVAYHRLLRRPGKLPVSPWRGHWALDSGGYNHLRAHGRWTLAPAQYIADVMRFEREIGNMGWAAPMDWMCEDDALAATGLTVLDHQRLTVANFVELEHLWYDQTDDESPFMPVLQGDPDAPADALVRSYLDCWEMYGDAGVDLSDRALVGLGSVCRQQATDKIGALVAALHDRDTRGPDIEPLVLHGFGCKILGLKRYGHLLGSADSTAWSARSRHAALRGEPKWDGCPLDHTDCRNCFHWALEWRRRVLAGVGVYDPHNTERISEIDWLRRRHNVAA